MVASATLVSLVRMMQSSFDMSLLPRNVSGLSSAHSSGKLRGILLIVKAMTVRWSRKYPKPVVGIFS